jgi:BirA family transcriptional regulator, biotin operon repressor / biotin---[acetyl-CoA-carboxylase] ligase
MSKSSYQATSIKEHLSNSANNLFPDILTLCDVTSTNDFLLSQSQRTKNNSVCLADNQSHCRGSRGNTWISNSSDICFSVLWKTDISNENLAGISLVGALAVLGALQQTGVSSKLNVKWPNDIFYDNRKLAGILIESTKSEDLTAVVIGIGINYHNDKKKSKLKHEYACLEEILPELDKNKLVATIINQLDSYISQYTDSGLQNFTQLWQEHDLYSKKEILVKTNKKELIGQNNGISTAGHLMLNVQDQMINIHSGKIQGVAADLIKE